MALYAGKISLETYFPSEELLKEAKESDEYLMPPHIRNKARLEYFEKRVHEMYRSHQELFLRTNNIPISKQFCYGPIRPPISFFNEEATSLFKQESF